MVNTRKSNKTSKASDNIAVSSGSKKGKGSASKNTKERLLNSLTEEEEMAIFKRVEKNMKAKKHTLEESDNRAIQAANQLLMQQEPQSGDEEPQSGNEEPACPPAKRSKQVVDDLSEEEAALRKNLRGKDKDLGSDDEDSGNDKDNAGGSEVDDEKGNDADHNEDLPDNDGSQITSKDTSKPPPKFSGNGISIEGLLRPSSSKRSLSSRLSSGKQSSRLSSTTPSVSSRRSSTPAFKKTAKSSKVTESDFPPDMRELAIAAKKHIRTVTSFDTPFPPLPPTERLNFAWSVVTDAAKQVGSTRMMSALNRASDIDKKNLTTYALYGRTALISNVISKARNLVNTHYGLKGNPTKIAADVQWLIEGSHFIFGDLDLETRTYDNCKPFFNDLIFNILESQWAPSSRSKSDSQTMDRIRKEENIPHVMILLVTTAIEHALSEWAGGQKVRTPISFGEETSLPSFLRHKNTWDTTAKNTRVWENYCRKVFYNRIVKYDSSQAHAPSNVSNLNFAELDRIAQEAMDVTE